MFLFSGFVLNPERAELRAPDGSMIRLRPKAFELLKLFAANSHRVLGKQDLMEVVWPGIHVGEDSLFQCIREIRTALGDRERQMIKLVSGRGYLFAVDVTNGQEREKAAPLPQAGKQFGAWPHWRLRAAVLASLGVLAVALLIVFGRFYLFQPSRLVLEVLPITDAAGGPEGIALSRGITAELVSGLSKIEGIDLVASERSNTHVTYQVRADLNKIGQSWTIQARLTNVASGEIQTVAEIAADAGETDPQRLQSRLAAGVGYALAVRMNDLGERDSPQRAGGADIAIQQAVASINQTTRERFATAREILETYRAADPENIDLRVALAGLHLRAVQMGWYNPTEKAAAETDARALLEDALRSRPQSIPVLGAYCRFLTATNQFAESLVACARALTLNPWDGAALYQIGLAEVQLGRFEDGLRTFTEADRFDTPAVSRWTWLLGAGWANLLLDRNVEAIGLLERSIAITPGSGRSYMLLATAYRRLGRKKEAWEALLKGMALRPDFTVRTLPLSSRNASDTYLVATQAILRTLVDVGLPTGDPR
ncbi:winged helix-turn-helix domain-containing protein [Rhizobium sp. BK602]|uniref:winged helix-turn-helix domain-containing protein n=1 Tax=Rhizobium sp. BK602 TaxID=2586986 RepID=UPI0016201C90|nr:winged helix-turn-helix domain-containing protein [Rhizobium sp. BK602]MBB3610907.1 DNA-binding winged helix-turn-helix (wHTH) protein/tetratricopeptide (TPR) repeat protein [Rhizobium sp. BK602]